MANPHSNYAVIDVTPTLSTDEYASGDIMFDRVEIPQAVLGNGGCSKLINVTYNSKKADDYTYIVYLMSNDQTVGTANAALGVSASNGAAAGMLGAISLSNDHDLGSFATGGATKTGGFDSLNFLLQAADDSTSVFLGMVADQAAVTFDATDSLQIILHIER